MTHHFCPQPKSASRLERTVAAKPLVTVNERQFKRLVWDRDQSRCRRCGRKVIKTLDRVPERGEVHHLHGRTGDLRFEDKAAVLLCLTDHERCTGRVNERWAVVATRTFEIRGQLYTDARAPVTFERIA